MKILYFDICALILFIILLISNFVRGMTRGKSNKFFMLIIIFAIPATIGDMVGSVGDTCLSPSQGNLILMYICNFMYFIFHNNIVPLYVLYCISTMGIWHIFMRNKFAFNFLLVPTVLQNIIIVASMFTHKLFYIDERMNYHRGPWLSSLYVCDFFMLFIGMIIIIKYRKMVNTSKFVVMLSMIPLILSTIFYQMYHQTVLIEMFVLSVEVVLFVLVIQRQEEYEDPISGSKKYNNGVIALKRLMHSKAPLGIILFKTVNNNNVAMHLGNHEYCTYLRNTSKFLKKTCREQKLEADIFYLEYGLFGIMCEEPNHELMTKCANEFKKHFEEKIIQGEYEFFVDSKICIVNCPEDVDEYTTLFTFALSFHNTLPDTKEVMYYKDYAHNRDFIVKNELDGIIKNALANNLFEMYYQPVYSTIEKHFVAAEALIRLHDPDYGDITPALFIPAAEISGDMHNIGNFIFEDVCKFYADNKLDTLGINYIQVNLSPSQCIEVDLVSRVTDIIKKNGLTADKITFELTESAADIDPGVVDANIQALNSFGIKFAIDDYGTGYSNIKRVIDLPIEMIKLDRKFILGLDDPTMRIIVDDTIRMLKEMGKKVVVSGIEDEDIARHFTELGCDYLIGCDMLQGFYFCKPLPANEFVEFIKTTSM